MTLALRYGVPIALATIAAAVVVWTLQGPQSPGNDWSGTVGSVLYLVSANWLLVAIARAPRPPTRVGRLLIAALAVLVTIPPLAIFVGWLAIMEDNGIMIAPLAAIPFLIVAPFLAAALRRLFRPTESKPPNQK